MICCMYGELPNWVTSFLFAGGENVVKINGKETEAAGQTVIQYLSGTTYDPKRIAVEKNGDIVPKAQYEHTVLQDGDVIEIVSFVGGG